uniref:Uncharacterized protein n=1 Tax=Anguilla anguilla TaxID=7936 RepID=A0A0E9VD32_ANGAN
MVGKVDQAVIFLCQIHKLG